MDLARIGVQKNSAFVPCQKGGVLTKTTKMTNLRSNRQTRAFLLRPRATTKMTKMAGVTACHAGKGMVYQRHGFSFPDRSPTLTILLLLPLCASQHESASAKATRSCTTPFVRDAEMTIKIIFERSSQKGGRQGVRKEGQQGTHLGISLSSQSTGKKTFWKVAFYYHRFFPRKYSDNNFGQLPPFHPPGGQTRGP